MSPQTAADVAGELVSKLVSDDSIRGLVFVAIIATVCALALEGRPVPDDLRLVAFTVIGYYFGRTTNGKSA